MDDTRVDETMEVDVNTMLECQLVEGSYSQDSNSTLCSSEKEESSSSFPFAMADIQGTISPRNVYVVNEGTMPALIENLLTHIKISPTFTKIKSLSLKDARPVNSSSIAPNEYLMWKLKEEKYLEDPVRWLIEKKIVPVPSSCRNHNNATVITHKGPVVAWRCGDCWSRHQAVLPSLFRKFENLEISDILAVTIHWACQSDLSSIMNDCKIDVDDIYRVWSQLQQICSSSVNKSKVMHAALNQARKVNGILEGAAFQFGNILIVGVMERDSRFSHLVAFPFQKGWNMDMLSAVTESILKNCMYFSIFVSDCVLFKNAVEKFDLRFVVSNPNINDPNNSGHHNLNIRHYVIQYLYTNFSVLDSKSVTLPVFRAYLDELQWRERFGHTAQMTFWNMLYRVAREATDKSETVPKRVTEGIGFLLKHDFDSLYPHECFEPPFPSQGDVDGATTLAALLSNSSNMGDPASENVEMILPSDVRPVNGSSETSIQSKAPSDGSVDSAPSVVVIEDDTVDGFCRNMNAPDASVAKATPDLSRLQHESYRVPTSQPPVPGDITGSVMFMVEGYITLTISNLLSIKTWPFILSLKGMQAINTENVEQDIAKFRKKLSNEGYFANPIPWMVNHQMVQENASCAVCGGSQFYLQEDRNLACVDKYVWVCNNPGCCSKKPYRRLKFFTLFGFPMKDILNLMYHWAAQTKIEEVRNEVVLNEYKIRYVYWAIQRVCSRVMEMQNPTLGGSDHIVEVGVVQFGQYCIIGAFDRETSLTRLKVVQAPKTYTASFVETVIADWLEPSSILVTTYNKCLYYESKQLLEMADSKVVINTALISRVLYLLVKHLFGKFSTAGLKMDMIQAFLDEIQWRERFGIIPEAAFWSLFYQIAQDDNIDLNSKKTGGLPQICQVGVIPAEMFSHSAESISASDLERPEEIDRTEKTVPAEGEENFPGIVISSVSSLTPVVSSEDFNSHSSAECSILESPDQPQTECLLKESTNQTQTECPTKESTNQSHESETPVVEVNDDDGFPGVTLLDETDLVTNVTEEALAIPAPTPMKKESEAVEECGGTSSGDSIRLDLNKELWDRQTITLDWKTLKFMQLEIQDCMSFLRAKPKEKPKSDDVKYYALDELYYARKMPVKKSFPERMYVYCCTLCKLYLYDNVSVMEHTLEHAEEKRKESVTAKDFTKCRFCPLQIRRETLEHHIQLVHESGTSLTCLICNQYFPASELLSAHMKFSHLPSEMPYCCSLCKFRSSLHKEVLEHFKETHNREPHLICPFCLKICSPRAKTDEILYTQTYCQHVIKHQQTRYTTNCPSCSLSFIAPADVQFHFIRDHVSFENDAGTVPFKPRLNPVIIITKEPNSTHAPALQACLPIMAPPVTEPEAGGNSAELSTTVSLALVPVSQNQQASASALLSPPSTSPFLPTVQTSVLPETSSSSVAPVVMVVPPASSTASVPTPISESTVEACSSRSTESVEIPSSTRIVKNSSNVKNVKDSSSAKNVSLDHREIRNCMECGRSVVKLSHFYKLLSCHCRYSSHCSYAFVNHMVQKHGYLKKRLKQEPKPNEIHFNKILACSCGFYSDVGDILAKHLNRCSGHIYVDEVEILPYKKTLSKKYNIRIKKVGPRSYTTTSSVQSHRSEQRPVEAQVTYSARVPSNTVSRAGNPMPPLRFAVPNSPNPVFRNPGYSMVRNHVPTFLTSQGTVWQPGTIPNQVPPNVVVHNTLPPYVSSMRTTLQPSQAVQMSATMQPPQGVSMSTAMQSSQGMPIGNSALGALLQNPRFRPYDVPVRTRFPRIDTASGPVPWIDPPMMDPRMMAYQRVNAQNVGMNPPRAVPYLHQNSRFELPPQHSVTTAINLPSQQNSVELPVPVDRIKVEKMDTTYS